MNEQARAKFWWLTTASLLLGSGLLALLIFRQPDGEAASTRESSAQAQHLEASQSENHHDTSAPAPTSYRAPPTEPAPQPLPSRAAPKSSHEPSECSVDADCSSPKLADCIMTRCEGGKCERDSSGCDCQKDADCDDGDSCTRDLCFASTKKCIHMKQPCDSVN